MHIPIMPLPIYKPPYSSNPATQEKYNQKNKMTKHTNTTPNTLTEGLGQLPVFLKQLRLDILQRYPAHTDILRCGVLVWVVLDVVRVLEDGVCGSDGHEFAVSCPKCEGACSYRCAVDASHKHGTNWSHCEGFGVSVVLRGLVLCLK